MKHVGINLRLKDGSFEITHPSGSGTGLKNALKNSVFKPILSLNKYHTLPLHNDRMLERFEYLSSITIDELYKDKLIVGSGFVHDEL